MALLPEGGVLYGTEAGLELRRSANDPPARIALSGAARALALHEGGSWR